MASFNHEFTVYQALWHSTHQSIFGSCSGDQTARIWDLRSGKNVKKIHAHNNEVLSMDFNKYENFIATGSTDNTVKVWDLRATTDMPIMMLTGHALAVRKVRFSPFHANILATASYDMSTLLWDCNTQQVINKVDNHSEFVVGADFSLFEQGTLATASWDRTVAVFQIDDDPKLVHKVATETP
jgi:peroxin-7